MIKHLFRFSIIGCLFLISACGPVHVRPQNKFTLAPISNRQTLHPRSAVSVFVSQTIPGPGLESTQMLYVTHPYQQASYALNRWVAPPASLLTPLIAQSLRNTGCFKAVVTPPFIGSVKYRVDSQLLSFQQEFVQPFSQFRLVLQVTILNNDTNRIVASRQFCIVVPAPENSPYGGVFAANKAVQDVMPQVARFVVNSTLIRFRLPRPHWRSH